MCDTDQRQPESATPVWGVQGQRTVRGLPSEYRWRVRMRTGEFGRLYVRSPGGITCYLMGIDGDGYWVPMWVLGRNIRGATGSGRA